MALRLMNRLSRRRKSVINNHIFQNAIRFGVSVDEDQERLLHFIGYVNCTNNHTRIGSIYC